MAKQHVNQNESKEIKKVKKNIEMPENSIWRKMFIKRTN